MLWHRHGGWALVLDRGMRSAADSVGGILRDAGRQRRENIVFNGALFPELEHSGWRGRRLHRRNRRTWTGAGVQAVASFCLPSVDLEEALAQARRQSHDLWQMSRLAKPGRQRAEISHAS